MVIGRPEVPAGPASTKDTCQEPPPLCIKCRSFNSAEAAALVRGTHTPSILAQAPRNHTLVHPLGTAEVPGENKPPNKAPALSQGKAPEAMRP